MGVINYDGQTGSQYSAQESKIRDAARVASELASKAPDHAYAVIWSRVFDAFAEDSPNRAHMTAAAAAK